MLFTLIAINTAIIMAMIFCAYTSFLNPHYHPNASYPGMMFPVFLVVNVLFIPVWLSIKWKWVALPLSGIIICGWAVRAYCPINPFTSEEGADIKFLSYNVMHMGDSTSRKAPNENPILLYIMNQNADIVCLQEAAHIDNGKNLDTLRTIYPYFEKQHSPVNEMAILSKYPIVEVMNLVDKTVNNRTFGYKIDVNGDTIMVLNNHFESYKLLPEDKSDYKQIIENPEDDDTETRVGILLNKVEVATAARGLQVDWLKEYIENSKEKYIILCGDFNDSPISYTHHKMTQVLNDAYTRGGNGPGWSYNRSGMLFRIDNIMTNDNFSICKTKVDNSINISDHYPIISWLKLVK